MTLTAKKSGRSPLPEANLFMHNTADNEPIERSAIGTPVPADDFILLRPFVFVQLLILDDQAL